MFNSISITRGQHQSLVASITVSFVAKAYFSKANICYALCHISKTCMSFMFLGHTFDKLSICLGSEINSLWTTKIDKTETEF